MTQARKTPKAVGVVQRNCRTCVEGPHCSSYCPEVSRKLHPGVAPLQREDDGPDVKGPQQ